MTTPTTEPNRSNTITQNLPSNEEKPHSADEAGGESVFSSDGLAPLPSPPPPLFPSSKTNLDQNPNDHSTECVLDSETSDPVRAFEVFQGRVFRHENGGVGGGADRSLLGERESAAVRLARIEQELKELEVEQREESERQRPVGSEGQGTDEEEGSSTALRRVVEELSTRLSRLRDDGSTTTMMTGRKRQEDLTSMVRKEMERLSMTMKNTKKQTCDNDNNEADAPNKTIEGEGRRGGGVVYELYGGINVPSTTPTTLEEQEERLTRIEAFLGGLERGDGTTLTERLETAEETLKGLDGKALDHAAARAKVIRADLEAAAKAHKKLSSTNTTNSTTSATDNQTIASLHETLLDLEPFISARALPTILNRLRDASTLHSSAASFGSDLGDLERTLGNVEGTLGGLEEAMKVLEQGMAENMEVVKRNVESLDRIFDKGVVEGSSGDRKEEE